MYCKKKGTIEMQQDEFKEVGIDLKERLFIRPRKEQFTFIYRTATEVHWDEKGMFLYSPKPREWSYHDWFRHLIDVADKECGCKLLLTLGTTWTAIPNELKKEMLDSQDDINYRRSVVII